MSLIQISSDMKTKQKPGVWAKFHFAFIHFKIQKPPLNPECFKTFLFCNAISSTKIMKNGLYPLSLIVHLKLSLCHSTYPHQHFPLPVKITVLALFPNWNNSLFQEIAMEETLSDKKKYLRMWICSLLQLPNSALIKQGITDNM